MSGAKGPLFFLHKGQFLQTGWQSSHIPPCKRAIFCKKCDQKLGYMFIPMKSASFLGDFHFCLKMIIPLCNLPHFWEIFTFHWNWSYPCVICLIFGRFSFFTKNGPTPSNLPHFWEIFIFHQKWSYHLVIGPASKQSERSSPLFFLYKGPITLTILHTP